MGEGSQGTGGKQFVFRSYAVDCNDGSFSKLHLLIEKMSVFHIMTYFNTFNFFSYFLIAWGRKGGPYSCQERLNSLKPPRRLSLARVSIRHKGGLWHGPHCSTVYQGLLPTCIMDHYSSVGCVPAVALPPAQLRVLDLRTHRAVRS